MRAAGLLFAVCFVTGAAYAQSEMTGAGPITQAGGKCLSRQEQRAKTAVHAVVPLSRAMRAARGRGGGEVLRARLCEQEGKLLYVLTLLGRDGKVVRTTVDARSGMVMGAR